jgi:hypothetical protein
MNQDHRPEYAALSEHEQIDADVEALVDEPWLETLQDRIDDYSDERTLATCGHEGGRMQSECWRHELARVLVITRRSMDFTATTGATKVSDRP